MYINGNLNVEDNISGDTFNFKLTPTTNNTSINLLVRNSTTGNIEQRTIGLQLSSTTLNNWSAFAQTGILVQTAVGAWSGRTLTAPAAGITITNANGISGNPTFALANDLSALEGLAGTGFAVRTGTDTWAQRSITGGTGIIVTNGTGTTNANVSISLPSSAVTALSLWSAGTGSQSVVIPNNLNTASGNQAIAIGSRNEASGLGAFAGGASVLPFTTNAVASGASSFAFTTTSVTPTFGIAAGAYAPLSVVIGGYDNIVYGGGGNQESIIIGGEKSRILSGVACAVIAGKTNAIQGSGNSNAIIGGTNATITGSASRTVVLGGNNLNATNSDTVYVPGLNIGIFTATTISDVSFDAIINTQGFLLKREALFTGSTNATNGGINCAFGGEYSRSFIGAQNIFAYGGSYDYPNTVDSYGSAILGGFGNTVTNSTSTCSSILGGSGNTIQILGSFSSIIGGRNNQLSGNPQTTSSVIVGGVGNVMLAGNSVILGGTSIQATDDETVYVPNFKTTGFTQSAYVSVGAVSSTLPKQTSVVIARTTARGGSVTITLPASPVDGQIISFRRTDAIANTCTIAPNAGYTLNVAGTVGNYLLTTNSKLRLVLVGTIWYDI